MSAPLNAWFRQFFGLELGFKSKNGYICSPLKRIYSCRRKGAVAQSVEQRTENPCVGGSIPPHTTKPWQKPGLCI